MRARAIVPQKALSEAKSRLGGALSPPARIDLALALLRNVCATLRAVPDIEGIVVITPDPGVAARVAAWGIAALPDPRPDLNAAIARALREGGRSHAMLIVAADLPLLAPADVVSLLGAAQPNRLVIASSKEGTGTNAVVVPPGVRFRPAYGGGSFAAHRRSARLLGYDVIEVRRPGLAFDIDNEADLRGLRDLGERGLHVSLHELPAFE